MELLVPNEHRLAVRERHRALLRHRGFHFCDETERAEGGLPKRLQESHRLIHLQNLMGHAVHASTEDGPDQSVGTCLTDWAHLRQNSSASPHAPS